MTKLYNKSQAFNYLANHAYDIVLKKKYKGSDDFEKNISLNLISRYSKYAIDDMYSIRHSEPNDKFIYDETDHLFAKKDSLEISKADYKQCSKLYKKLNNLPNKLFKPCITENDYDYLVKEIGEYLPSLKISNKKVNKLISNYLQPFIPHSLLYKCFSQDYMNQYDTGNNSIANLKRILRLILLSSTIIK